MNYTRHTLLYLLILVIPGIHTYAQDSTSLSSNGSGHTAIFPGKQHDWDDYLRKNVDTTVPVRNKAKKGSYTVVVKFIIAKDGTLADVQAVTNNGYGMEEEVIRVLIKSPRWGPVSENNHAAHSSHTQSFIFVVPKKKGAAEKRS